MDHLQGIFYVYGIAVGLNIIIFVIEVLVWTVRKTERQNDRMTEWQKDRKTERQKDRKTERQNDRKTKDRKS